ncbi:NADPH-dependent oxidoreductase [Pseudothauera nasutitermitis]|uniref:NADPH-dependent oxidoreductase n=1 Tax=Pseudothauera nasutitermitis TaxID=2565930 RepID=A0A4V3WB70_9RHOO|nr:nitroreductase family protein [Pseudothauera nasutitermitis]THF61792.1 NADPH-dependent oxidoreductase [Pseudothauera nasutitermitis]
MNAQARLNARYGNDTLPAPAAWTPVIDHLLGHRSVRHYLPDAVSNEQLAAIVAAAQSAATSSNLQTWSVIAVRDAGTRAALAECAGGQAHVREAPLQLVWLADLARLAHIADRAGRPREGLEYLEMFVLAAIDAALAAQNALAAAESLGLAGCYIGGLRNQPERVAELLGLPPRVFAVFGMTLGSEDPARPAAVKPRLPQEVVLHQERYRPVAEQQPGIDAYDAAMAAFYAAQGMNVHGTWGVHSVKRVADGQALTGRDRLAEALHALGFGLR